MSDSKFDVVSIESSISVPNFTTLPQVVICAAIDFQSGRIRNLTDTIGAIATSVLGP